MHEKANEIIDESCFWSKVKNKVAVIFVSVIACVLLTGCRADINLNDYIIFETSGYDGYGTVYAHLDSDALKRDFGEFFKAPKSSEIGYLGGDYAIDLLVEDCIDFYIDKTSGLSNGDTIKLTWNCNNNIAKNQYSCDLKYFDISYTVEGLKEVQYFDPFEDISVTFSGMSPMGTVEIDTSNCRYESSIAYVVSQSDHLKNGDIITIWADLYSSSAFVQTYGMAPSIQKIEYEVQGLATYATDTDEITDNALVSTHAYVKNQLKSGSYSVVEIHGKVDPYTKRVPQKITYVGNYLLTNEDSYSDVTNRLYLIYQIDSEVELDKNLTGEMVTYQHKYYYLISYDNVYVDDGRFGWENRKEYYDEFTDYTNVIKSSYWDIYHALDCYGYQTINEVKDKIYDDYYANFSNIKESRGQEIIFGKK